MHPEENGAVADRFRLVRNFALQNRFQRRRSSPFLSENALTMRRRSRFVGNGEENAAAEGSFQSKPPECTAAAKLFPKGICEPARRKILDQAKF